VEWPTVLIGHIDKEFLELPAEVLQVSMRQHQKFFSLKRKKTNRIEGFITVANIKTKDQGATILRGNQKVLSARLSDAKFFLENDLRVVNSGMLSWIEQLKNVTFHKKLGNQNERVERLRVKSIELSDIVGANKKLVEQAALFAKADLASEMVYEFPELQGVMGSHYAKFCDFPVEVALAIREHYSPLGPTDKCPTEPVSVTVSLADKLDVLISFWKAGERPTGSKDPFALRRAALGVIRILVENNISLDLVSQMSSLENEKALDLLNFIYDRFRVFLRDDDVTHDIVDACSWTSGSSGNGYRLEFCRADELWNHL
jgi:glycyl-tRNA synthetase beta chain